VDNPVVSDSAWFAWRGFVAHGWRPVATGGAVTAFVRGSSSSAPPFQDPPHDDAIFCQGWFPPDQVGHQMSSRHGSLWVYGSGILRLFMQSPQPERVRISVDGRFHSQLTVDRLRSKNVGLAGRRWHLITFDSGPLFQIRGKPRGARIVAYALP
jgi:hypothetical protein